MTLLQICKMVCREVGIPNGENAIVATTGNTGELARIVGWAQSSWTEVQNQHQDAGDHWRWLRHGFTLATVASQASYAYTEAYDDTDTAAEGENTAISRFRKWLIEDTMNPPKMYLTSGGVGGEGWLHFVPWDQFKFLYHIGTQNDGYPIHISISPDNKLHLGPAPDAVYTVTGDFLRANQPFTAEATVPEMPADFHELIAWKAIMKYGLYESAPECITNGEHHAKIFMGDLRNDQLPKMMTAGAMA